MKKPFRLALFAIIALTLSYTIAHAETGIVAGASTSTKPVVAPTTTTTVLLPNTLTARKAAAEAGLRDTHAQFALFVTRTQLTIDRLQAKDIDTTTATKELAESLASLDAAKTNLDLFAKIVVSDDMTDQAIAKTPLKSTLTLIQDDLKNARAHLIASLTALKTTVSLSIDTQIQ